MSVLDMLFKQASSPMPSSGTSPMNALTLLSQLASLQGGGASSPVGDSTGIPGGASPFQGGNLQSWIDQAEAITGVDSPTMDRMLRILVQHESGGNPTIVNQTPTPKGYHAVGLAQMIPPTFDAYNIPGLGGITNPVANLSAAIRYMIDRYGSVANTPGIASVLAGHGYQPY